MQFKKEIPSIIIITIPFIYLAYIWKELPQKVPMHWDINGKIDRYGDKTELILIPISLPLLTYLIFVIVPLIDPKNKLNEMGNKLQNLKFYLSLFMSALALYIIYSAKNQSLGNPNFIILGIGILFMILGNYFKTIKTNYFIGIRTPWTLENETVWKKTHQLGGKLWFVGGLLIFVSSLFLEQKLNLIVMIVIAALISLIPILYSYFIFQKEKKKRSKK